MSDVVYRLPEAYAVKEASIPWELAKMVGIMMALTSVAPTLVGFPTGALYSNMTNPSGSDLKDIETEALAGEIKNLKQRLQTLPGREAKRKGSDVAWRGGLR